MILDPLAAKTMLSEMSGVIGKQLEVLRILQPLLVKQFEATDDERALSTHLSSITTSLSMVWLPYYEAGKLLEQVGRKKAETDNADLAKVKAEHEQMKKRLNELAGLSDELCNAKREIKILKGEPLDETPPDRPANAE